MVVHIDQRNARFHAKHRQVIEDIGNDAVGIFILIQQEFVDRINDHNLESILGQLAFDSLKVVAEQLCFATQRADLQIVKIACAQCFLNLSQAMLNRPPRQFEIEKSNFGVSPTKVRKVPQKCVLDSCVQDRLLVSLIDRLE
jgi:hypothetical protein